MPDHRAWPRWRSRRPRRASCPTRATGVGARPSSQNASRSGPQVRRGRLQPLRERGSLRRRRVSPAQPRPVDIALARPTRWIPRQTTVGPRMGRRSPFQPWFGVPRSERGLYSTKPSPSCRRSDRSIRVPRVPRATAVDQCHAADHARTPTEDQEKRRRVDRSVVGVCGDCSRAPSPRFAARGGSCRAPHPASRRSWSPGGAPGSRACRWRPGA